MALTMDARKLKILRAIIDDYILTAMPVGSRTLERKYDMGFSSATIRNEMSDLEALGYLEQPHVSAGRVPSPKAYRLYVDGLMEAPLPPMAEERRLRDYFGQQMRQMEDLIPAAAHVLSELTHYTAVVMMPKQHELKVSCLQLVPMPGGAALLVIVTDSGAVRETVIRVSELLDADGLYAISRMLTERLAGHSLSQVQQMLQLYTRAAADMKVLEGISQLAAQMEKQTAQDTIMVGGSHNILSYPEYADVEKARAFLSALEDKERLMNLLRQNDAPFRVHIGTETGLPEMADCSVVAAAYTAPGNHRGALGVIGPVRMPYDRVLSVLDAVGKTLTDLMGG